MSEQLPTVPREAYNRAVKRWAQKNAAQMRALSPSMRGELRRMLREKLRSKHGLVDAVFFLFPRYAVHLEKGASRTYGGRKGSTWFTRGDRRHTAKSSLGRMNTLNRMARPVINPVLDKSMDELADIAVTYWGDLAIDSMRIK